MEEIPSVLRFDSAISLTKPLLSEVIHDKQEYLSVAYGNMVGILIEAIKELKTKVDKLGG